MEKVSEHITYADAIRSDTAKRMGLYNYFTPEQLERMRLLAEKVYEPLVTFFGVPIRISSFFRSAEVNKAIGGAKNSQHMANNGAAMDIDVDNTDQITNRDIFNYIMYNLEFDQLILEDVKDDGSVGWVHVSYRENNNRKQVLTMVVKNGKKQYEVWHG